MRRVPVVLAWWFFFLVLIYASTFAQTEDPASKFRTPIPDPTLLTTQQLLREQASLKELFNTRLEEMGKAVILLQSRADRVPSETDVKLMALRDVLLERFKGVDIQFSERDTRADQTSKSMETAINAALQAQKELVAQQNASFAEATRKAEVATKERLDQLTVLFQTSAGALDGKITLGNKALEDKIASLYARLGAIEGSTIGQAMARGSRDTSNMLILTIIAGIVGIVGLGVAVFKSRTVVYDHRKHEEQ